MTAAQTSAEGKLIEGLDVEVSTVKLQQPPVIVAELSGNHQGKLENALALMDLAHECGADMIKIQTYTEDSLTIDSTRPEFQITKGLWAGYNLYQLYQEAKTPREWMKPLFAHARARGIKLFSSPFYFEDVDALEEAGCPIYKIASYELNFPQLIAYCADTKKPMVMSTGMATLEEIDRAVQTARDHGCTDLTLLHCESLYPAPADAFNLKTIPFLKARYGCKVGLSNHSIGHTLDVAATALGADMIEKHFARDRSSGIDAAFSMTPDELKALKEATRLTAQTMGYQAIALSAVDQAARGGRRSVYLVRDLKQGETLTDAHVRIIRPGLGLEPSRLPEVLGQKARRDLSAPQPLDAADFS